LIVAGVFLVDWFTFRASIPELKFASINLISFHFCPQAGPCGDGSMSQVAGTYPTFARAAFWSSMLFGGAIAVQLGLQQFAGAVHRRVTQVAGVAGVVALLSTLGAAYLFGPDPMKATTTVGTITIARHFGPLVLLAGIVAGFVALWMLGEDGDLEAAPRKLPDVAPPPRVHVTSPEPAPIPVAEVPVERDGEPPRLQHAAATAELSAAGINARLANGSSRLVMWADIVGIVARKLPPGPFDGAEIVDVISTPGATVRIVSTTRLSGDPVVGDGLDRVRALIAVIVTHRPDVKLDIATRAVFDQGAPLRQLVDAAELASHDARLP